MSFKSIILLIAAFLIGSCTSSKIKSQNSVSKVAFGSCNHQKHTHQPLWDIIAKQQPEAFIWTGDAIYETSGQKALMQQAYTEQSNNPQYKNFVENSGVQIIGVWDDNDYGMNNGGKEFQGKKFSQQLFLDFIGEPKDSPRRHQKGVYASYVIGQGRQKIKIYLLDVRYNRDTPNNDGEGDLLGEEQWQWLESELKTSDSQVNIFVSGTQIIPKDHPFEKWNQFPQARDRFFQTLKKFHMSGVILISGDRHIAEFSKLPKEFYHTESPIFEITASGMTHAYDGFTGEKNQYRVGEVFFQKNYGFLEVDWSKQPAEILLEIRDEKGMPQDRIKYPALPL